MGSVRSPVWRHGGTVHGPQPRDYSYKLPKKMELGALRSALSAKLRDGELKVIEGFTLADHKTKTFKATLGSLECSRKVLVVDNGDNKNLALGTRNLPGVKLVPSFAVNVYDLLGYDRVLVSQAAATRLSESLGPKKVKEAQ
jgi:large subunit ribosomal protein L4